jgi:DNA-binding transcriptional LysR family regulator
MDLRQLQAFYLVGKHGNLAKAGSYLQLTPPAISIQLKKLETELQVKLFEHRPNKLVLTDKGRVLVREVKSVFDALSKMQAALGGKSDGYEETISIAFGRHRARAFAPQIAAFKKKYPRLRISIHSKTSSEVIAMLLAGDLDLGISSLPRVPRGIQKRKLLDNKLYLIFSHSNSLKKTRSISLTEVAEHPIILHPRGVMTRKVIDAGFAAAGIDLENILEVGHCESIIEFVRVGLGVGFVHGTCLPTLDRRNIGWHDMTEHFDRTELSLVYRKSSTLKPLHRALLDALAQSAKEMLLFPRRTQVSNK